MKNDEWYKQLKKFKKFNKILVICSLNTFSRFKIKTKIENIFKGSHVSFLLEKYFHSEYEFSYLASKKFLNSDFDLLISIGGGSTIDFSKNFLAFKFLGINKKKLYSQNLKKIKIKKNYKFVAIPTTAGTGSESTQFSVIYINKKKFSIENSLLLPDASILDPKLSFTCSKKQKITSAVDALCQSIESLWSLNSTHLSIKYAKKSFKLVWGNIYDAIINKSFDSHAKLLIGSNYSGKAINISKTTAPHAISYYISKNFNIPHGLSVMLTITQFLKEHAQLLEKKKKIEKINQCMNFLGKEMKCSLVDVSSIFKKKMQDLGVETSLIKYNILENDLNNIANAVDTIRLKNHPVKLKKKDILEILKKSL